MNTATFALNQVLDGRDQHSQIPGKVGEVQNPDNVGKKLLDDLITDAPLTFDQSHFNQMVGFLPLCWI
jgi:hypothetical protein